MRSVSLSNREIYHIYNRGVDKRNIFLHERDYQRFADGLVIFNSTDTLNGKNFNDQTNFERKKLLVNIIAYCLMPNHFHLLLEQRVDDGITKFLQKMTTSYTMYFNRKYTRTGALIQGVFKRSHIKTNPRLLEISQYIHANPIKILKNTFSNGELKEKLLAYPWSSFPDYAGVRGETLIVSNNEMITKQFRSTEAYIKHVLDGSSP